MISKNAFINEFIDRYNKKTRRSKDRAQSSRAYLSDCRASAGFRFSTKELLYQIVAKEGRGSRFVDIDGNEYVDIAMGFGALFFGHYPEFLEHALKQEITKGIQLGAESDLVFSNAKLFHELTGNDRVTFCNSGTEAVMTAIRLARLKTGKPKIAIFEGAYHGFYDSTLVLPDRSDFGAAKPMCDGLPDGLEQNILLLKFGDNLSLELLEKNKNSLAAVLVEPVRSRFPNEQNVQFLQKLRDIADGDSTVLIFDEVITGFRCHQGGAQKYFNINADLATYGKILGGGLSIGAIAGRREIMGGIDGGEWDYGNASYPSESTTFFAGTFCKNPLVMAACGAILSEIKRSGNDLNEDLNRKTKRFVDEVNEILVDEKIPVCLVSFGSLFRFSFSQNIDLLFYSLIERGVYVWEGRNFFFSTAHTDEDIRYVKNAIIESVLMLKGAGMIRLDKS